MPRKNNKFLIKLSQNDDDDVKSILVISLILFAEVLETSLKLINVLAVRLK